MAVMLALLAAALPVRAENPPTFVRKWGSSGIGNGQFNRPVAVAVGAQHTVYVADLYNHRIQAFSSDGAFIRWWGGGGSGNGQFQYPTSVAVDTLGNVYVVDSVNNRIQKFTGAGVYLGQWGTVGSGDGEFANPQGMAIDGNNNVYVTDTFNDRVEKFTSDGAFVKAWGINGTGAGEFNSPTGIATDSHGDVYVCDMLNNRIEKFSGDGIYLAEWGSNGAGVGQFAQPFDVAVDSQDRVYVADTGNHRIQKFTSGGTWRVTWGGQGVDNGKFQFPQGVGVDPDGDIYVADTYNHRIQKFSGNPNPVTLVSLGAERRGERVVLRWQVHDLFTAQVAFRVFRGLTEVTETPLRGQHIYEFVDESAPREALEYWLQEEDGDGASYRHGPIRVAAAAPLALELTVHPNPFQPATGIRYVVPDEDRVTIAVYTAEGRRVATLVDHVMSAGQYEYRYEPSLASGVYFVRLSVGAKHRTAKLVLLR